MTKQHAAPVKARLLVPAQYGKPEFHIDIYEGFNIVGQSDLMGHEYVSKRHALIEVENSMHWIEDLSSSNGTFIDDMTSPIRERRFYQLLDGNKVLIGRLVTVYKLMPNEDFNMEWEIPEEIKDSISTPKHRKLNSKSQQENMSPAYPSKRGLVLEISSSKETDAKNHFIASASSSVAGEISSESGTLTHIAEDGINVLFTGFPDAEISRLKKKITKLGIKIAGNWKDATHLVAKKVIRTTKFLCSLASKKPIISIDWIKDSIKSNSILDIGEYHLKDRAAEKKWGFSLSQSMKLLEDKGANSVAAGKRFIITPSVTPDKKEIEQIILACGGTVIETPEDDGCAEIIVISCVSDHRIFSKYKEMGIKNVLSPEFILMGALTQNLDYDTHKIHF